MRLAAPRGGLATLGMLSRGLSRPVGLGRPPAFPSPFDVRVYKRCVHMTSRPLATSIALGTAQGFSGAVVAAVAHRAMHASASTPAVVKAVEPSITPALRQINTRLVRSIMAKLGARPHRGPREALPCAAAPAELEPTVMRAWRNCCELRQGGLAIELYGAWREQGVALRPERAADAIRYLGESWLVPAGHQVASASDASAWYTAAPPAADGVATEDTTSLSAGNVTSSYRMARATPPDTLRTIFLIAADAIRGGGGGSDAAGGGGDEAGGGGDAGAPLVLSEYAKACPPVLLDALIAACADVGAVEQAYELHTLSGRRGAPSELRLHKLIGALSDAGQLADAASLVEAYGTRGLRNSTRVKLMGACVSKYSGEEGAALVRELHATRLPSEGVAPTLMLIRALGTRDLLGEALEVYRAAAARALPHSRRLRQQGVHEQLSLLNAALHACASCGDPASALKIYHDAARAHPSLPDAASVNTLLSTCASSNEPAALTAGFQALVRAAAHHAADVRGVATLLAGCERVGHARLAALTHTWAHASGVLDDASPAARGILLDGLFHTLSPTDEHDEYAFAAGDAPADSRADADSSVLGDAEALAYATGAYVRGVREGAPFEHAVAQRCLLILRAAASDFTAALSLLHEAEAGGVLLAPSDAAQRHLLNHLDRLVDLESRLGADEHTAAIELFAAFTRQRGDVRWLRDRSRVGARAPGDTLNLLRRLGRAAYGPVSARPRRGPEMQADSDQLAERRAEEAALVQRLAVTPPPAAPAAVAASVVPAPASAATVAGASAELLEAARCVDRDERAKRAGKRRPHVGRDLYHHGMHTVVQVPGSRATAVVG